jgi:hypothetical protein
VKQGGSVDELDDRGVGNVFPSPVAAQLGTEHDEDGTHPFAAGFYDVGDDLFDVADPSADELIDRRLELIEVLLNDLRESRHN